MAVDIQSSSGLCAMFLKPRTAIEERGLNAATEDILEDRRKLPIAATAMAMASNTRAAPSQSFIRLRISKRGRFGAAVACVAGTAGEATALGSTATTEVLATSGAPCSNGKINR